MRERFLRASCALVVGISGFGRSGAERLDVWCRRVRATGGAGHPAESRGAVEPLVALVAVLVVSAGIGLYATALADATPERDRDLAAPALEETLDVAADAGVVVPDRVEAAAAAGPTGYRMNVTLAVGSHRRTVGPDPGPGRGDRASRDVPVRLGPGRIAPGRLVVTVWHDGETSPTGGEPVNRAASPLNAAVSIPGAEVFAPW